MPWWHALVLGIVQGASEFLPISSSAHLELVPWVFGWDEFASNPDLERAFAVALHLGTFAGVAGYFRKDIAALSKACLSAVTKRKVETADERKALLLAVSALPAAIAGVTLDALFDGDLASELAIGVLLIVFGVVLYAADRARTSRREPSFGIRDSLLMGGAQALALIPGVSRAGATISAGRILGFGRDDAARLGFLMSLPVIAGAGIYEGVRLFGGDGIPQGFEAAFAIGMTTAGLTGFAAVWGLIRLVRRHSFTPFVIYRLVVGAGVIALALSRR